MQNSRIVTLATFAMVVVGGVETAFADSIHSFTTIDVRRALHNISSPRQFGLSAASGRLIFANAEITGNIWMLDTADKK
jgi:hypothetical protein